MLFRLYNFQGYASGPAEAAAQALKAGTDLECGVDYSHLMEALGKKLVTEDDIDRAARRVMLARFRLGMFDPPERVPYASIPYSVNDSAPHRQLAREAERKAIQTRTQELQNLRNTEAMLRETALAAWAEVRKADMHTAASLESSVGIF